MIPGQAGEVPLRVDNLQLENRTLGSLGTWVSKWWAEWIRSLICYPAGMSGVMGSKEILLTPDGGPLLKGESSLVCREGSTLFLDKMEAPPPPERRHPPPGTPRRERSRARPVQVPQPVQPPPPPRTSRRERSRPRPSQAPQSAPPPPPRSPRREISAQAFSG